MCLLRERSKMETNHSSSHQHELSNLVLLHSNLQKEISKIFNSNLKIQEKNAEIERNIQEINKYVSIALSLLSAINLCISFAIRGGNFRIFQKFQNFEIGKERKLMPKGLRPGFH
jgi:hypothetical protein